MRKIIIPVLVLCIIIPIASALSICTDTREINKNCTMVTSSLTNCTAYNYTIHNITGSLVSSGNLSNLYGDVYLFNFTEPEGDYVVEFCDGTTRQIRVTQEDSGKMIIGSIILLPMILGFFFLIGAATLGKQHAPVKIFLFLLSVPIFWVSLHFGMLSIIKFYDFPELQEIIGTTVYWTGWVLLILITYFLIYLFYHLVHAAAQKKREELEY